MRLQLLLLLVVTTASYEYFMPSKRNSQFDQIRVIESPVSEVSACDCTISQGSFSAPLPFLQSGESAVDFYAYGAPDAASANTGLELTETLLVMLHENTQTGNTSLVIILDDANDATGGDVEMTINCLPDSASIGLGDEANEVLGGPPTISGDFFWSPCCTDGAVINGVGCGNTFTINPTINSGINAFSLVYGTVDNPTYINMPDIQCPITINCGGSLVCCDDAFDVESTVTNPGCDDSSNGAIDLTVDCATTPQYIWSNGAMTEDVSNLTVGEYFVTITEANGCSIVESFSLTASSSPPQPSITGPTEYCVGEVITLGLESPYSSYNWSTGLASPTILVSTPGDYAVTVTNAFGCTGTTMVSIIEHPEVFVDEYGEYCQGSTYIYPPTGQSYTAGDYSIVHPMGSAQGCDSTTLLHVSENPIYFTDVYRTICYGASIIIGGVPYSTTGTYQINLTTQYTGCDSIIYLDLSVLQPISIIQETDDLGCGVSSVFINGAGSLNSDQYFWTTSNGGLICGGQGTPLITACAPGTYCLEVSSFGFDQSTGQQITCTDESCVTIENDDNTPTISVTSTDVNCGGGTDGTATVSVISGGVEPFIYVWNTDPIQASPTASELEAGTYQVTVTGANGCTSEASVLIEEPVPMSLEMTSTSTLCAEDSNGSAGVSISGGSPNYSFVWNTEPVQTVQYPDNLMAGTYSVTVTDANMCTSVDSVTIEEAPILSISIDAVDNTCYGDALGFATANVAGGTGQYTFEWSTNPIQDSITANGLAAGTYTVIAEDANGCTISETININEPDELSLTLSSTEASCGGNNDGSATVTVSGGSGDYSYEWNTSPIQETPTAIDLAAGNYTVIVTDDAGCTTQSDVLVSEPSEVDVSITTTDVLCFGQASGSASISINGGTGPYSYNWDDPDNQMTATASDLMAGTYFVTIEDANNCQTIESVTISELPELVLTESSTPVGCFGEVTGSASVEVEGGTGPYSFVWDDPAQQLTSTATDLPSGTYCVEVTDANDCIGFICVDIEEPSLIQLSTDVTDVDCFDENTGIASVIVSGGTAPYFYNWNDPLSQDEATATNLSSGIYLVEVSDANGCTEEIEIFIDQPDDIELTTFGTGTGCSDSSDGEVSVSATGGTPGYTYIWDDPNQQESAIASDLQAGTYMVVVADLNGCTASASVSISAPDELSLNTSQTNVLCNGENTDSATVEVTGGTGPFTYQWDDDINQNTPTASSLPAQTYNVVVEDANGCTASAEVILTEPDEVLSANGISTNALCGENNGTIDLTVSGGLAPYAYDWNGSAPNIQDPINLGPGSYSVIVTDANNCTVSTSVTVMSPDSPSADVLVTEVSCYGANDGIMDISVSGGIAPYQFVWSIIENNGNEDLENTVAGNYSVTVTDDAGCTVVATGIITEPDLLEVMASASPTDCDIDNGSVSVVVNGGTAPFDFDWNIDQLDGFQSASDLPANTYEVLVTDANGCTAISSATVGTPDGPVTSINGLPASCNGASDGSIDLTIDGGTAPFEILWNDPSLNGFEDPQNLSAGIYTVQVVDLNGCESAISFEILEPEELELSLSSTALSCYGANDGTATVTANGGTAPYVYQWCDGQNTSTAVDCFPGLCTVTITDVNGCTTASEILIEEPPVLTVDYISTPVECYNTSTGSIDISVDGGTAPYIFEWSGGLPAIEDPANLGSGTYEVLVTDANDCSLLIEGILIESPMPLTANLTESPTDCGVNTGSVMVDVNGGMMPYTFDWSDDVFDDQQNPVNMGAGYYEVIITDANGCTILETSEIITPDGPSLNIEGENIDCFGDSSGSANLTILGGTAPYDINWGNPDLNGQTDLTNLPAGVYDVLVIDANNCANATSIILSQPDTPLALSATSLDATCNQSNGSIDLTIDGGVSPYVIDWSGMAADVEDPQDLFSGSYNVTVTDNNNCIAFLTQEVNTPTGLSAEVLSFNASCFGQNDGAVDLNISGGTSPYTFVWDDPANQTIEDPQNLLAGNYNVIVTDADGCSILASATIEEPNDLQLSSTTNNASCNQANGNINLTVSGGTSPYTFDWNGGLMDVEDPQNVFSGNYEVVVTDANGCTAFTNVIVTEPDALALVAETFDVDCNGNTTGTIELTVTGGTGTYTFEWNDPNNQTVEDPQNLGVGVYTVIVTDANDCTISQNFEIFEPELLIVENLNPTDVNCYGANDGTATIVVDGGTAPYDYDWSDDSLDGQDAPDNLSSGDYSVTVTDANDCYQVLTISIFEPDPLQLSFNTTDALCFNSNEGSIDLNVSGGLAPYTYDWNSGAFTSQDLSDLFAGNYTVIVTDANDCTAMTTAQINQPSLFEVAIDILSDYEGNDVSCADANDGILEVTVNGGVAPFVFQWDNGMTDAIIENLPVGTYEVIVFDANGCTASGEVLLNGPAPLESLESITDPSCTGDSDGMFEVFGTGGTAPYLYSFEGGAFSSVNSFSDLPSGNYNLMIQDLNGCEALLTVTITDPVELQVTLGNDEDLQMGDSLRINPVLNIPNNELDSFSWQPDFITNFNPWVRPYETTQYQITVVSDNGCVAEDVVQIRVDQDRNIYIPNAFSPNDDGLNDHFMIYGGVGVEEVESFQIFNRWGELLFEAYGFQPNDPDFGWDGRFRDEQLNPAVFVYIANVKFLDGKTRFYKGDVSLLR